MNIQEILCKVDHTLLAVDSTWEQIKTVLDDGIEYGTASVCIPASFVRRASAYSGGRVKICTVVGFPNGYSETEPKFYEAYGAVHAGADEVDMVANIGDIKEKNFKNVLNEINRVKSACGDKVLKVIIETCLLTEDEKIQMCEIVSESGADFIKTSTGFSKGGATFEDIKLMKAHCFGGTKIKAAGGIHSLEDAEKFIELGADRLGTSRVIKIVKALGFWSFGGHKDESAY